MLRGAVGPLQQEHALSYIQLKSDKSPIWDSG